MLNSLTLFPKSMDPQRLEEILSNLIPAFKRAQGLYSLKVSEGHLMSPGGPPAYSKVVEASFESLEDFMAWVQTQNEDPAAQADKEFMMESGAILLFYEVNEL